ncbi:trypsin-7-like [Planococcus citri]|uniref:trypsin-7-like n=1 Tax=Planococcus citri TaxID=170843 RepID=UPI0031FA03A8
MFLASMIVFINVVMIQLLQMPIAEGVFINRRFPMANIRPQRSTGTVVSKCPKCDCRIFTRKKRILGGIEAKQNEFPWMVALRTQDDFLCGATVITKQHLLTAAHCVEGITAEEIEASLGEHNRELKYDINKVTVGIKEIIQHPGFTYPASDNDIAILKLDRTISFNIPQIQPACLPNSENRDYAGYFGTVIGWGSTDEKESLSNVMRKVKVPIIPTEDCRTNYSDLDSSDSITDNMICAGYNFGKHDACAGDSGGPLQINLVVTGIVSWGIGCGRPYYPAFYTRIDRYRRWIHDNIGKECLCEI